MYGFTNSTLQIYFITSLCWWNIDILRGKLLVLGEYNRKAAYYNGNENWETISIRKMYSNSTTN
jgi:hypothetical protein